MITHADHRKELSRLNRIEGQVRGIRQMVEDGRYCVDILNQTRAVRSALAALEGEILTRHMHHCVHGALSNPKNADQKIEELITLFKRGNGGK